jgi:hypothetical protein
MFQKVLLVSGFLLIASSNIYSQEAKTDTAKSDSGHIDQYIPTITVEEVNDNQDDDVSASGSQNGTGMSFRSQDQFLFISGFVLGQYRFRPRGLDNMDITTFGLKMRRAGYFHLTEVKNSLSKINNALYSTSKTA